MSKMPIKYYTKEKVEEIKKILENMEKENPQQITQKNLLISFRSEIDTLLKKGWSVSDIANRLSENGINIPVHALKKINKKTRKKNQQRSKKV